MSCKFSNLDVGEIVHLSMDWMYCYHCNAIGNYSGTATYRGHGEFGGIIRDCFDIVYQCSECQRNINQYIEACKGEVFVMQLPVGVSFE